jgi:flagellar assembly factor FliW
LTNRCEEEGVAQMTTTQKIELGKLFFEEGLPGFQDLQFYQLLQVDPDLPFFVLQAMENEDVQFYVIEPFVYFKEYEFELNEQSKNALKIQENTPVAVLNIITVRPDGQVTANMKAPIVINQENRMAKQVILNEESYSIRQPLFQVRTHAASE